MANPVANNSIPQIDQSIQSWLYNIKDILHFPVTVLAVASLLVAGAFAESAPRKSLEFLNTYMGRTLFFILPIAFATFFDWATGLLCGVVALIFFARIQINDPPSHKEGFMDDMVTEIVPTTKRWFVEKVLGETPIAISSDRVRRGYTIDDDVRTSSSSSMEITGTSDGSSHK